MSAVEWAIEARLQYLRRELEIAEREAERPLLDVSLIRPDQRAPFEGVNRGIAAARSAIPKLRAEVADLEAAL